MQRLGIPGEDHRRRDRMRCEFIAAYKTGRSARAGRHAWSSSAPATPRSTRPTRRGAWARRRSTILYRRGERDMSAFDFEYEHAKQEGVRFLWRRQPVAIRADEHGMLLLDTRAGASDDRQARCCRCPARNFTIDCDMVIPAIGQSPLLELAARACAASRCATDASSSIAPPASTGNPQYFAGGDCVNGGREVVDAVADGKRAALAIAQGLRRPPMPDIRRAATSPAASSRPIPSGWPPRRPPTAASRSCAPSMRAGAARSGRPSASPSPTSARATPPSTGTASA